MSVFPTVPSDCAEAFLLQARAFLSGEYLPKLRRCLERLAPEDLWWRPAPASNSVGNLVLHVCGNARQWIVCGIGGRPDVRVRSAEFAATGGLDRGSLDRLLTDTFAEVDGVLETLRPADLSRPLTIQGFRVSALQAVFHVVEHVSGHAGQILYITKQRTGQDLRFYGMRPDGSVEVRFT